MCCLASCHQSRREVVSWLGAGQGKQALDDQVVHGLRCGSPLLAKRSAVQQRSRPASQWTNLTRGSAQHFQIILDDGEVVEPWKEAR
jgi:hypothetical protein